ncbi:MAG: ORF6N domain-containing protein [Bacilli bacterium]|nr:ORF6N domain-containing protein [Bacilli bacterium]
MNELVTEDINVEDMIYEIRGKYVMLDSDLAKLYQCKNGTKEVNQAVKRNIEKFPERFSWILSDVESKIFLVTNCDQKIETRGGKFKNPRVFTEQGVAMLATILKSKVATQVSIRIMDAFVTMKKYISNNLIEQKFINNMVIEHDSEIKLLQESFNKFEEKRKVNEIYFNGQIFDSYYKIMEIFKSSKKELIIVDRYVDLTILDMIKNLKCIVLLVTSKNRLTQLDIEKYNKQYNNLIVKFNDTFHDRYFIIDKNIIYHSGTSINHAGSRTFSINILEDDVIKNSLIKKIESI